MLVSVSTTVKSLVVHLRQGNVVNGLASWYGRVDELLSIGDEVLHYTAITEGY